MTLSSYNVDYDGFPTVLRLSDADAKKRGLTDKDKVGASKAEPKAPAAKPAAKKTAAKKPAAKKATPANKAAPAPADKAN